MKHRQLIHSDHQPRQKKHPVIILLDNVKDAKNVGSVFRIADAMGIKRVYLTGSTPAPPNKEIKKTSRSTEGKVSWEYIKNIEQCIQLLRNENHQIISIELTDMSKDLFAFSFANRFPLCLIAGDENEGVSQYALDYSDDVVHIPMLGINSSMNVSMATAIVAFEAIRQSST